MIPASLTPHHHYSALSEGDRGQSTQHFWWRVVSFYHGYYCQYIVSVGLLLCFYMFVTCVCVLRVMESTLSTYSFNINMSSPETVRDCLYSNLILGINKALPYFTLPLAWIYEICHKSENIHVGVFFFFYVYSDFFSYLILQNKKWVILCFPFCYYLPHWRWREWAALSGAALRSRHSVGGHFISAQHLKHKPTHDFNVMVFSFINWFCCQMWEFAGKKV